MVKCSSNGERCQTIFLEKFGMIFIIWYGREYSPARGCGFRKDIITKRLEENVLMYTIKK
jgi:hypothetical protein